MAQESTTIREAAGPASSRAPRQRRRQWIVDRPGQLPAIFATGGLLVALVLVQAGSHWILGEGRSGAEQSSAELGQLALWFNFGYFIFLLFAMVGVVVVITHRYAGPARVIEHALDAFRAGEYAPRLALRERDQLKGLAAAASRLGQHLRKQELARNVAATQLEARLRNGDLQGALASALALREATAPIEALDAPATAPTQEPAR